jgi:predicted aspartyl protease
VRLGSDDVVLPVRWRGLHALLDCRIDGLGPFTFLLDTGCNATFITPGLASRLPGTRTSFEKTLTLSDASGATTSVTEAVDIGCLVAGGLEILGITAIVQDMPPSSGPFGEIHGILGMPALSRAVLVLDFPGKQVLVSRTPLPPPDGRRILPLAGRSSDDAQPWLRLDWNGTPLELLIDSGASPAIMLNDWPEGVEFLSGPVTGPQSQSALNVPARPLVARLRGALRWGDFGIVDPTCARREGGLPYVGLDALRHYRVALDMSRSRVRFDGQPGLTRMTPLRGTGACLAFTGDGVIASEQDPHSTAAAAGLEPGDVVLSVQGVPIDPSDPFPALRALTGMDDTVSLRVRRGTSEIELRLRVVTMVP